MNKIVRQDLDEIIAENLSWKKLFNSTIVVKFRQVNKLSKLIALPIFRDFLTR